MSQSFGSNRCDFPCKIVYPLRIDESMLKPGAARMRGSNGMDEETAFVSKFSKTEICDGKLLNLLNVHDKFMTENTSC